jgi:hypothetical protein
MTVTSMRLRFAAALILAIVALLVVVTAPLALL